MSDSILDAAEREERQLLARLNTVRQVISLLRGEPAQPQPTARIVSAVGRAGGKSKRQQIEEVVVNHLVNSGRRASSGELFGIVQSAGIAVGGDSKALASTLSTSDKFNNIRELGGYGLLDWGDSAGPAVEMKDLSDESNRSPQVTGELAGSPIEAQTHVGANG